jgi:hypothetical protein
MEPTTTMMVPVFYIDAIMSVDIVGPNVRIVLGETRRIDGAMVRLPVLEIVRPLESAMSQVFEKMLSAAIIASQDVLRAIH